jgi:hypothetical protein
MRMQRGAVTGKNDDLERVVLGKSYAPPAGGGIWAMAQYRSPMVFRFFGFPGGFSFPLVH